MGFAKYHSLLISGPDVSLCPQQQHTVWQTHMYAEISELLVRKYF